MKPNHHMTIHIHVSSLIVAYCSINRCAIYISFEPPLTALYAYVPSCRNYCLMVFNVSNTFHLACASVTCCQIDISNYLVRSCFKLVSFCIFCPCVNLRSEGMFAFEYPIPCYVSWITTLRMFSTHIIEPTFQVSIHFKSV